MHTLIHYTRGCDNCNFIAIELEIIASIQLNIIIIMIMIMIIIIKVLLLGLFYHAIAKMAITSQDVQQQTSVRGYGLSYSCHAF